MLVVVMLLQGHVKVARCHAASGLTLYCSCLRTNQAIHGPRGFSVAGLSRAQAGGSLPLKSELDSSSSAALKPISPDPAAVAAHQQPSTFA